MESGFHGPDGNAEAVRHISEGKIQVIDHDHQGPLDRVELADASLDLVAVSRSDGGIGRTLPRRFDGLHMQLESEAPLVSAHLAITGVHEDAPHPGVEAIRI